MSNILSALAIVRALTSTVTSISGLVDQAKAEGRDLTDEEMDMVKERRDKADDSFEEELERRTEVVDGEGVDGDGDDGDSGDDDGEGEALAAI